MKSGEELEKYVQHVYNRLLNLKDEGIIVGQNVTLKDKHGIAHQIDVYYQFERADITHKVAIECKDWSRPVNKGEVTKFFSNVRDIGNIQPVLVAKCGFQSSAIKYASIHDIVLLTSEDLPNIGELLAKRLKSVALPDSSSIGVPFWTIYEMAGGENTGTPLNDPHGNFKRTAVVFFSKKHAELYLSAISGGSKNYAIRGLEQHQLRAFLILIIAMEGMVRVYTKNPDIVELHLTYFEMTPESLAEDYFLGKLPKVQTLSDFGIKS